MSITFNHICELLESLEKIFTHQPPCPPKRAQERADQAVTEWISHRRQALDDPQTNCGAILSMLFPEKRKDRVYFLKSQGLGNKLTGVLQLKGERKALLDAWQTRNHGDLGACLQRAIKTWDGTFTTRPSTSIEQVDRLLTQLAAKCRFSSPAIKQQLDKTVNPDALLKNILGKLESWEAKWLVRIILTNLCTIQLNEHSVLRKFHFLLSDLLKFQNDFDAAFNLLRGELHRYPPDADPDVQRAVALDVAKHLRPVVGVKIGRPTFHKAWSFKNCFQLMGKHAWAAEMKYDGEYCEIHVDLEHPSGNIQIFSKNGKDATNDRQRVHGVIRDALRIGQADCLFTKRCIVLGELVVYSDREEKILEFSKIRQHVSRSSSYLNANQDSLPHEWEHLMIVFFDVLLVDDEIVLRKELQQRREVLRHLIKQVPGRAMRSKWALIDANSANGTTDLKQIFALSLARREEGIILKLLHGPYFALPSITTRYSPNYFIKLKKDYLADMGGERDLGDFAVIGASYNAQVSAKLAVRPLHYTHFYLACLTNAKAVRREEEKRKFKVVAVLSADHCIPKPDLKWLNERAPFMAVDVSKDQLFDPFDIRPSYGDAPKMQVAFKEPFVVEILGSGYEKAPNERFYMLRHPRLRKIHHDRTWEDAVTMDDLERMSEERWAPPNADKLDGHAKEVALLVKQYAKAEGLLENSQESEDSYHTTQNSSEPSPRLADLTISVPETLATNDAQQDYASSYGTAITSSTRRVGILASNQLRLLSHEQTFIQNLPLPQQENDLGEESGSLRSEIPETQEPTPVTATTTSTTTTWAIMSTQRLGRHTSKTTKIDLPRAYNLSPITKPSVLLPKGPDLHDATAPRRPGINGSRVSPVLVRVDTCERIPGVDGGATAGKSPGKEKGDEMPPPSYPDRTNTGTALKRKRSTGMLNSNLSIVSPPQVKRRKIVIDTASSPLRERA